MAGSVPGQRRGGRQKGTPNKIKHLRGSMLPGSRWIMPQYLLRSEAKPLPDWVLRVTPVDAMLYAMRAAFAAKHYMVAADLASKVAPYVHPRLNAVQMKHEGTLTLEQLVMESMQPTLDAAMAADPPTVELIEHVEKDLEDVMPPKDGPTD